MSLRGRSFPWRWSSKSGRVPHGVSYPRNRAEHRRAVVRGNRGRYRARPAPVNKASNKEEFGPTGSIDAARAEGEGRPRASDGLIDSQVRAYPSTPLREQLGIAPGNHRALPQVVATEIVVGQRGDAAASLLQDQGAGRVVPELLTAVQVEVEAP